jgi:hypothetical protein
MVDVSAFLSTLGNIRSVPIVSAALAYDHPYTYESFMLIIHQALHFPTMEYNLLNPNQLRLNDVQVNDCPQFLLQNPTDVTFNLFSKGGYQVAVVTRWCDFVFVSPNCS